MTRSSLVTVCAAVGLVLSSGGCTDKKKTNDHAKGTPTTAKPATAPRPRIQTNTKLVAYSLGSKLALAAVRFDDSKATDKLVSAEQKQAALLAKLLGSNLPAFPDRKGNNRAKAVDGYLRGSSTKSVLRFLVKKHSAIHGHLFSLGLEAQVTMAQYSAKTKDNAARAKILTGIAKAAQLPDAAVEPLAAALSANAPKPQLAAAHAQLRIAVQKHLQKPPAATPK